MNEANTSRLRAAVVAATPIALLIGFLYHPYVTDEMNHAGVAATIAADPTRWLWAHLVLSGALVLSFLTVVALRMYLHAAGDNGWSLLALPLLAVGLTLITLIVGFEGFGGGFLQRAHGDVAAYLAAAARWWLLFAVGGLCFALGWLSYLVAIWRTRILGRQLTWLVTAGIVVMDVAFFVPAGWGGIVSSAASVAALWPVAYAMWRPMPAAMLAAHPAHG